MLQIGFTSWSESKVIGQNLALIDLNRNSQTRIGNVKIKEILIDITHSKHKTEPHQKMCVI